MKLLSKIYKYLFLAFPAVLYFSYFPLIHFGANDSMNFELSLPLFLLVIFDIVAIILIISEKKLKYLVKYKLWLLYPVFVTVSIVWSLNSVRGILTSGILWALYIAGFSIVVFRKTFLKNTFETLKKVIYASAGVAIFWCVVQCILDLFGVGRDVSLLCVGCTKEMFGFPHPNGFAIEPQFMGNLLIAPALIAASSFVNRIASSNSQLKRSRGDSFYNRSVGAHTKLQFRDSLRDRCKNHSGSRLQSYDLLLAILFAFGVFLTFSRGAIYAFVVGVVVLLVGYWIVKNKNAKALLLVPAVIVSFLLALNMQGIMAANSGLGETYGSGVAKVLNHLSLGVIDLREKNEEPKTEETNTEEPVEEKKEPVFDGYVAESTETRVKWTNAAIDIWKKNFNTLTVGAGVGGAGQALYNNNYAGAPKEIVQNEYVSVLLETGVIGFVLFIFTIGMAFYVVWKKTDAKIVIVIMTAYGITLFFFSGFPNALHIYLLPVMLAATYKLSANKKAP